MTQYNAEYWNDKVGKVGATGLKHILAKPRSGSGEAATRTAYKTNIALQRITGIVTHEFSTEHIKRGIEREPDAAIMYELITGNVCEEVGFIDHPTIQMAGCSPDRVVTTAQGDRGLLEIKCPSITVHWEYLQRRRVPPEYTKQLLWQAATCGVKWIDFISFNPEYPEELQFLCVRFYPDETEMRRAEEEVKIFLLEVAALESEIRQMMITGV